MYTIHLYGWYRCCDRQRYAHLMYNIFLIKIHKQIVKKKFGKMYLHAPTKRLSLKSDPLNSIYIKKRRKSKICLI